MLFWDLHLGRGSGHRECTSWRQPCAPGVSCLTELACFQLSGENLVLFQPKIGSTEEAVGGLFISLRWAESSQVFQWILPMTSRAVSDGRFFLASCDDSHKLSFLFVYCLVCTHYSSVLFLISCNKMKTHYYTISLQFRIFNLFLVQGFANRKVWNSLGSLPLRWRFWRALTFLSLGCF